MEKIIPLLFFILFIYGSLIIFIPTWNSLKHTDEENLRWAWLRAIEWGKWPLFISQPLVPILLMIFKWWIIIIIIILTWLWKLIRYKHINIFLLDWGSFYVRAKWPISIIMAIFIIKYKSDYFLAAIHGLWPLITLILSAFCGSTMTGTIQKKIMYKFGYRENYDREESKEFTQEQ